MRHLVRPLSGHIPIYMHADFYMLWGEPLAGTTERIRTVTEIARDKYGRRPEFSLSLRLVIGATEDEAWGKARAVEPAILDAQGTNTFKRSSSTGTSIGRQRQLAAAEQELHDGCFWTALVAASPTRRRWWARRGR